MPRLATWLKSDEKPASQSDRRLAVRFLKYWEGLRHDQSYPLITDLNLDEIGEFVPYTFNLDLSEGIDNPRFRFIGRALVRDCGGDVTNQDLSALLPQSMLARAVRKRAEVVADGRPYIEAEEYENASGDQVLYRAVMLPFSSNGREVDYIIGAISSKTVPAGAAEEAPREDLSQSIDRVREPLQDTVNERFSNPSRKEVSDLIADVSQAMEAEARAEAPAPLIEGAPEVERPVRTAPPSRGAHVIVLGSEKGGTGKSTTAMHLVVSLLYEGRKVGTIDLDSPQFTLTRYIENRQTFTRRHKLDLPLPTHTAQSDRGNGSSLFENDLARLSETCDFVVIDTPGSDSAISRMAHARADTLVTPINDSFVDLDTLAVLDPESREIVRRGHYAELVAHARKQKESRASEGFDWIILRNRLSNLDARNKQQMADTLEQLSGYLSFRNGSGLSERVIYRELFLKGLTLLDLRQKEAGVTLSMSHVAARQELRALLEAIGIGGIGEAGPPRAATG